MIWNPRIWLRYLRSSDDNFSVVVAGQLYGSATPTPEKLEHWKTYYQIKTWVDLRMPKDWGGDETFFAAQCLSAKRLGIERISLPLDDFGVVSDEQIRVAMDLMGDPTKWPMLWACKGGRHRRSLMIGMFQLRAQGWTGERVYEDAKKVNGYYPDGHRIFDKRFRQLLGLEAT